MKLTHRAQRCVNLLGSTYYIPGSIIELGVGDGSTSIALALRARELGMDKKIFSFDTFSGLPAPSGPNDGDLKAGECCYSLDNFKQAIERNSLQDMIVPVVGLVEDTLPEFLRTHMVSFAWVDMDLYAPTSFATKILDPNLCLGSVIGYHDYDFHRCPGIKIVADKELSKKNYCQIADSSYNSIFFTKIKL